MTKSAGIYVEWWDGPDRRCEVCLHVYGPQDLVSVNDATYQVRLPHMGMSCVIALCDDHAQELKGKLQYRIRVPKLPHSRGNWMDAMAWMDTGEIVARVGSGRRLKMRITTNRFGPPLPTYFCQFEKEEEGAVPDWTDWHEYTLTYDDVHATDWRVVDRETGTCPSSTLSERIQALIAALQAFAREQEASHVGYDK